MNEQEARILLASARRRVTGVRIYGGAMVVAILAAYFLNFYFPFVSVALIVVAVIVFATFGYPGMRDLRLARRALEEHPLR